MLHNIQGNHDYVKQVALITVATFLLGLVLTLTHEGYLGVDGGAYILHAEGLLGMPVDSALYFDRPPLAPGWLLLPFTHSLGVDVGYKVWSALFATIPMLPAVALLAFRLLPVRLAIVAVLFAALDPWHWEMLVTGAVPLTGIAFLFLALWGLIPICQARAKWYDKAAVAGSIGLIPYLNQTATGLAGVAIPIFLLSLGLQVRSWHPLRLALPWLALGSLLALPAIFLSYEDVFLGSPLKSFPGPKIFVPAGYTGAWLIFAYGATIAYGVITKGKSHYLRSLAWVLLTHSILPLFWSYDESIINVFFRSQHVASPLIALLGTWYVANELRHIKVRTVVTAGVALLAIMLLGTSIWTFQRATQSSDMITPHMREALALIPPDGHAILTTNGGTAFWVSALKGGVQAYSTFSAEPHASGQRWYPDVTCILGWTAPCDPLASALRLNIRWVLIDTRFPFNTKLDPPLWGAPKRNPWEPTIAAHWLEPLYSAGTVRLWSVKDA